MRCTFLARKASSLALTGSLVLIAMLIAGCGSTGGGLRIHSAERDKQGQAVKDAWSKVDLKSQLDVPRQNLAKTLAEQLSVEEEIWSKRRSIVAGQMAGDWTVATFRSKAAAGMLRILGSALPPDTAASAAASYRMEALNVQAANDNRDRLMSKITMLGVTAPTCAITAVDAQKFESYVDLKLKQIPAERADKAPLLSGYIKQMSNTCKELKTAQDKKQDIIRTDSSLLPSGELRQALLELQAEETVLETSRTAVELAAASLKAAQADYDTAEKALETDSSVSTKKQVDDAIAKLKTWQSAIGQIKGSPFLDKLVSEARLDALDKFLATYDAAASGKGTDAGSNRLAVALALIPDMQKKSAEALANTGRPNLVPFVLRKNIEQAKADAAKRDTERMEAIVELRRKIVASLEGQLEGYAGAYDASLKIPATMQKNGKDVPVQWAEALQAVETKPNVMVPADVLAPKIAAWRASTRYLEAEGQLRADVGQNYYRIYALQYEGVLLYAESSIQQWKGLVDPSVDLLAQWGSSGVIPQDIIQLFNSLMLLGIAVGVN